MKLTVASQYNPTGGLYGGGVRVHEETELLPGVRYALVEKVEHKHKFKPAGIKTIITRYVGRFERDQDGLWGETSRAEFKTLAQARKAYKACSQHGGAVLPPSAWK